MPIDQIVVLLIAERDRLNRAIDALQGETKRRGRPPKKSSGSSGVANQTGTRKHKPLTAEHRKAHSERMKKYWAERRKSEK